jgi:hypothetical protein
VPCSESQQKWLVGLRRCELAKRQRRPETGYLPTLRLLEPTTTHAHSHRTRGSPCGARTSQWSRRRDLNPRPTHYECVALPLSYPGRSRNHTGGRQQVTDGWRNSKGSRSGKRIPVDGCGVVEDSLDRRHGVLEPVAAVEQRCSLVFRDETALEG